MSVSEYRKNIFKFLNISLLGLAMLLYCAGKNGPKKLFMKNLHETYSSYESNDKQRSVAVK